MRLTHSARTRVRGHLTSWGLAILAGPGAVTGAFAQTDAALSDACYRKAVALDQARLGLVETTCRKIALYQGECAGARGAAGSVDLWRSTLQAMNRSCSSAPTPTPVPAPAPAPQAAEPAPNPPNPTRPVRPGGWGASHCLTVGKVWSGGISSESAVLKNSCNEMVRYTYCVDSAGDGVVSCRKQKFGAGSVRANSESAITVMGETRPMRVHWNACFDGGQSVWPLDGQFNGGELVAECRPLMGGR
jgi:hypothetical protein